MKYSLHNHTYRCKHAVGSEEDMVVSAIEQGIELFGIGDHIPYLNALTIDRMEYDEKELYLKNISDLKQKYHNKIKLKAGFEVEYQCKYHDYLCQLLVERVDYLILGQHYHNVENNDFSYEYCNDVEDVRSYVTDCIKAMKTGLFIWLAHPDICLKNIKEITYEIKTELKRLIAASIKYQVPLEYNAKGVRINGVSQCKQTDYSYPNYDFWHLVAASKALVVVDNDAHAPYEINDVAYRLAYQQAVALRLNIIEDIDLEAYLKRYHERKKRDE